MIAKAMTCDRCNRFGPKLRRSPTDGEMRQVAREQGWRCTKGRDICPTCAAEGVA